MKRKRFFPLLLAAIIIILTTSAFALDESEVQSAIAASSKTEVSGNLFIWLLCAVAFLKISQKIDSFLAGIGVNVGRTGGSMIPITDIRNGIIHTEDGRYIKILEVEPINFLLRNPREQRNIISGFASWMKISPVRMQIKVLTKKADISRHLENLRNDMGVKSILKL